MTETRGSKSKALASKDTHTPAAAKNRFKHRLNRKPVSTPVDIDFSIPGTVGSYSVAAIVRASPAMDSNNDGQVSALSSTMAEDNNVSLTTTDSSDADRVLATIEAKNSTTMTDLEDVPLSTAGAMTVDSSSNPALDLAAINTAGNSSSMVVSAHSHNLVAAPPV